MTEKNAQTTVGPSPEEYLYPHQTGEVTHEGLSAAIAANPEKYHPGLDSHMEANGILVVRPAQESGVISQEVTPSPVDVFDALTSAKETALVSGHEAAPVPKGFRGVLGKIATIGAALKRRSQKPQSVGPPGNSYDAYLDTLPWHEDPRHTWTKEDIETYKQMVEPAKAESEGKSYEIHVDDEYVSMADPSVDMVAMSERMERQGFAKEAPRFTEQVNDTTRTNLITRELKSGGNEIASEYDSLQGLKHFLTRAQELHGPNTARKVKSIEDNLTFIGKKEYDEAARGIAESWRQRLQSNPNAQIGVIIGRIARGVYKSDAYLLDTVLQHFSEEELEGLNGRLVLNPAELTADPKDVSVVLLDDWTISGQQLSMAGAGILSRYPQYRDKLEIQLVAATKEKIEKGLTITGDSDAVYGENLPTPDVTIPIRAYYAAHESDMKGAATRSGAHITGYQSSVDFDFEQELESLSRTEDAPLTHIFRPYRHGYKMNRLARFGDIGRLTGAPAQYM